MKKIIRNILGGESYIKLSKYKRIISDRSDLVMNFVIDFCKYYKHSNVFSLNTFEKLESKIILDYHGIEKGFLHEKIRPRFARERVKSLIKNLQLIKAYPKQSNQILISNSILKRYYEYHKSLDIEIEDFFPSNAYLVLEDSADVEPVLTVSRELFFHKTNASFDSFSHSRKSIRSFKEDIIEEDVMKSVIDIARNAPSVCNRQASKVYYTNTYAKVQKILSIQGGMRGFKEEIKQLMVVTIDRNYFYTVGERNQMYIDGGIFLMNLLYSLHFKNIGACCANWGKEYQDDLEIAKILELKPSEKVICVVVIGICKDEISYTLSQRREVEDIIETR